MIASNFLLPGNLGRNELELDRHPGGEFEGDVLVGKGAAVAAGLGPDANGAGFLNPLLGCESETVQAGLDSNPVEFDGIKLRVVQPLPNPEEFDGVAVAQPVADDVVRVVGVLEFGDVSKAQVVGSGTGLHGYHHALDFDDGFLGLAHDVGALAGWLVSD